MDFFFGNDVKVEKDWLDVLKDIQTKFFGEGEKIDPTQIRVLVGPEEPYPDICCWTHDCQCIRMVRKISVSRYEPARKSMTPIVKWFQSGIFSIHGFREVVVPEVVHFPLQFKILSSSWGKYYEYFWRLGFRVMAARGGPSLAILTHAHYQFKLKLHLCCLLKKKKMSDDLVRYLLENFVVGGNRLKSRKI